MACKDFMVCACLRCLEWICCAYCLRLEYISGMLFYMVLSFSFPCLPGLAHLPHRSRVRRQPLRTHPHPVSASPDTRATCGLTDTSRTLSALLSVRRPSLPHTANVRVLRHGRICGCHDDARVHCVFRFFICMAGCFDHGSAQTHSTLCQKKVLDSLECTDTCSVCALLVAQN